MNTRWQVSFNDGTLWTEVHPLNGAKLRITMERDLENGQIFFRKKINAAIRFGKSDYPQFLAIERNASQRCNEILVRAEIKCAFTWQEVWRGKFSTGSGKFELDNCVFEVKPQTVDAYTCIFERQNIKRNLLNTDRVTVNAFNFTSYEFFGCYYNDAEGQEACASQAGDPNVTGWTSVADTDLGGGYTIAIYVRFRETTECVGGNPAPPPGTGWILLSNDCATNGTATYVKELGVDDLFELNVTGIATGTCEDGVAVPPASGCGYPALLIDCDDPLFPSTWACITPAPIVIDTAFRMDEALQFLVDQMDCGITGVRSDFFGIDPVGDAPGYVEGLNYVTGLPTKTEDLIVVQKSDAIDPDASNPATIGEMTFKEIMKALNVMFQVYWRIDERGRLRIEHWKYWDFPIGLDITSGRDVIEPLIYEHQTGDVPRVERLTFMEAQSRDFVGADIVYGGACVNTENDEAEKEYSPGKVTTDISFVISDPDAISKTGFVFLATVFNGTAYDTIIEAGAITGNYIANAPMSVANLERDYWTWNRYLPSGNMNRQDTTFNAYRPNITQEDVGIAICCDYLDFDPTKRVTSALGQALGGIPATVETAEFSLHDYRMDLTLLYSY